MRPIRFTFDRIVGFSETDPLSAAAALGYNQHGMQVTEIFFSIQGESSFAGEPCVFVRLTACNLRCSWCDTEYAFYGGQPMEVEEVLRRVSAYPARIVEITGGEPMLQERELLPLMARLLEEGYRVLLETSGERFLGRVPPGVVKVMDVKCPGSGEAETFRFENLRVLTPHDEVKFVLADRADYEFARQFLQRHALSTKVRAVIFSPVFEQLEPRQLAEWILTDGLEVRLGLQLHKFIWDPAMRGV